MCAGNKRQISKYGVVYIIPPYCEDLPSDTNIFRTFTTVVKKLQL